MAKVRTRQGSIYAALRRFVDLPADLDDSEACALFNAAACIKADLELEREKLFGGGILKKVHAKRVLELDAQIQLLVAVVNLLRLRKPKARRR